MKEKERERDIAGGEERLEGKRDHDRQTERWTDGQTG